MSTILSACTVRVCRAFAAASRPNRSWKIAKTIASLLVFGALLCGWEPPPTDFIQEGSKLVGGGTGGAARQGLSVALSADGNTAIVGGPQDNSDLGAAWVFTRSAGVWSQQAKLVGTGAVTPSAQGSSVALSADGNTAIVGGYGDNSGVGAAWVFTRSAGVWTPQGGKLVGNGAVGGSLQGFSVALSADGNTAIVGGPQDSIDTGAAWVFSRSAGVWTSQGGKLVGSGAVGANVYQGTSVALSADGNTAIVGGPSDDYNIETATRPGAAWVFTRSGGVWTQQGSKLVGTGAAAGGASQGTSVTLSADGNTAIVGGPSDKSNLGAAWAFTRSGGVWTQQGSKLVGTGAAGPNVNQGTSVALAGDGNTAIVGGIEDNLQTGALWVFARSGGVWTQQGSKLVGAGAVGGAEQGFSVALSGDSNTAIVGGPFDNSNAGAAWVFVPHKLAATPTAGAAPLAVTFRASGLTLPMTYTINFGDGTTGALTQGSCIGMFPVGGQDGQQCSGSASHLYTKAGTDTAVLLNASGVTVGAVTITVGDKRVAQPPLVSSTATSPPASPPVTSSTPTPGQHSLGQ
jgi:hypothetical protein